MIRAVLAAAVIFIAALAAPHIAGANSALLITVAAPFFVVWLLWPRHRARRDP